MAQDTDALAQRLSDVEEQLRLLEATSVKHSWLNGIALAVALAIVGGTWALMGKLAGTQREMKAEAVAVVRDVAAKVERMEGAQTQQQVKVEALYLLNIERKPREQVRREAEQKTKGD